MAPPLIARSSPRPIATPHGARQVRVHDAVKALRREFVRHPRDAGRIHQHIQYGAGRHHARDRRLVGHIERQDVDSGEVRMGAAGVDLRRHEAGGDHLVTVGGERQGGRAADAAGAARDQGDAPDRSRGRRIHPAGLAGGGVVVIARSRRDDAPIAMRRRSRQACRSGTRATGGALRHLLVDGGDQAIIPRVVDARVGGQSPEHGAVVAHVAGEAVGGVQVPHFEGADEGPAARQAVGEHLVDVGDRAAAPRPRGAAPRRPAPPAVDSR